MNMASAFQAEISRVSRKELRSSTSALKRAYIRYQKDLASLRVRIAELELLVKRLSARPARSMAKPATIDERTSVQRFSAKGITALRRRLALSAAEMGLLLGVSGQSVYRWEHGKSNPRVSQMAAINAMRKMGKRDVAYRLSVIQC